LNSPPTPRPVFCFSGRHLEFPAQPVASPTSFSCGAIFFKIPVVKPLYPSFASTSLFTPQTFLLPPYRPLVLFGSGIHRHPPLFVCYFLGSPTIFLNLCQIFAPPPVAFHQFVRIPLFPWFYCLPPVWDLVIFGPFDLLGIRNPPPFLTSSPFSIGCSFPSLSPQTFLCPALRRVFVKEKNYRSPSPLFPLGPPFLCILLKHCSLSISFIGPSAGFCVTSPPTWSLAPKSSAQSPFRGPQNLSHHVLGPGAIQS